MADIPVQELGANGAIANLTFTVGSVSDSFVNTGVELVIMRALATFAVADNPTIEGVPAQDSGRDGSEVATMAAALDEQIGGPYKPRNFVVGGSTTITGGTDPTKVEIAVIRPTRG